MKFRNYKDLLEKLNEDNEIIITVSLWTYSSKRQIFKTTFNQIKNHFSPDMFFNHRGGKFHFIDVNGKDFSFRKENLKIVKVDYAELSKDVN